MPLESFSPMQLAVARGYEWQGMLERGEAESLKEISKKYKVDTSYVSPLVNLALLPPHIVQLILDDELPDSIRLVDLALDGDRFWVYVG